MIASSKKLSILMAVYNEKKTVGKIIEALLKKHLENIEIELIIIESQSTDGTREIIQQYEKQECIKIIWQKQALGKGNAIREGLEHVTGDFILIQDADDEYDIGDYDALIAPLMNGQADFVLGSRHNGNGWKIRQFDKQPYVGSIINIGHWLFTFLINTLFNLKLRDPFTMYKVFRKECLQGLVFNCNRFDFDCELLLKLIKNNYLPIEIPVHYKSRSFKEGKKIKPFYDPWTWLKIILKLRLQKG